MKVAIPLALLGGTLLLQPLLGSRAAPGQRLPGSRAVPQGDSTQAGAALEVFRKGCDLDLQGDLDGAIRTYDRALELDSHLAEGWASRGAARGKRGDTEGAISDSSRALALNPRLVLAWFNRGTARKRTGDLKGALADLDKVIELDARFAAARVARSSARCLDAEATNKGPTGYAGAIEDATVAIELDPNVPLAWWNRAVARDRAGDLAGARDDYEAFVARFPNDQRTAEAREQLRSLGGR